MNFKQGCWYKDVSGEIFKVDRIEPTEKGTMFYGRTWYAHGKDVQYFEECTELGDEESSAAEALTDD